MTTDDLIADAPAPAQSWLDIIPPIPLAKAVPVVRRTQPQGWPISHGLAMNEDEVMMFPRRITNADTQGPCGWRVDIDDPQGFAYAARYHYQQISHPNIAVVPMPPAQREAQLRVLAWLVGDVTDADRFALATALAEVSR